MPAGRQSRRVVQADKAKAYKGRGLGKFVGFRICYLIVYLLRYLARHKVFVSSAKQIMAEVDYV